MKIEAGKYYRTRDGDVVGPMAQGNDKRYPWMILSGIVNSLQWNHDGDYSYVGEHSLDLVSEVYVSDTPPADALTLPSAMLKPQDWRRLKPIEPSPETKTLRDEFAMAALTGMITADHEFTDRIAEEAYEIADAMMEARKK